MTIIKRQQLKNTKRALCSLFTFVTWLPVICP